MMIGKKKRLNDRVDMKDQEKKVRELQREMVRMKRKKK